MAHISFFLPKNTFFLDLKNFEFRNSMNIFEFEHSEPDLNRFCFKIPLKILSKVRQLLGGTPKTLDGPVSLPTATTCIYRIFEFSVLEDLS